MDRKPHFNNPEILKAIESVRPQVDSFVANLDAISSDIKGVEKFLEGSAVRVPVSLAYYESGIAPLDGGEIGEDFCGGIWKYTEHLAWEPDQKGTWRIMYRRSRHNGNFDVSGGIVMEGPSFSSSTDIVVRPLIETQTATRIGAYPHLPKLIQLVGDVAKVARIEIPQ